MSKFTETLQTTTTTVLLTMLVTAPVTMLGTIWLAIQDPLADVLIQKVPKSILLLLPILLLLLLSLTVSYIFYLRKKIKNPIEDYEFDPKYGVLRNPKDGFVYCLSCLLENIKSPMLEHDHGWICNRKECGKKYSNEEKVKPNFQKISKRDSKNWVTNW